MCCERDGVMKTTRERGGGEREREGEKGGERGAPSTSKGDRVSVYERERTSTA